MIDATCATRAKMWARGRNMSVTAPSWSTSPISAATWRLSHTNEPTVNSQPLGIPVVPDVYTSDARSAPATAAARCITSSSVMSAPAVVKRSMPPSSREMTCSHTAPEARYTDSRSLSAQMINRAPESVMIQPTCSGAEVS
jgi:hypothetical protein